MKRVLLLCQQELPIELSPARYQLINELYKLNYEIYVFSTQKIKSKNIREEISHFINTANWSINNIRDKILRISPEFVFAFTFEDTIILYNIAHKMKDTRFVYYNLEIYTPDMEEYIQPVGKFYYSRCRMTYIKNKIKEICYVRRCDLFIIQDDLRKKISAKYYIYHRNTLLIPNSYSSGDEHDFMSKRQGIICSGGMNKLVMKTLLKDADSLRDIPITFSGWCDEWVICQFKKLKKYYSNIEFFNQQLNPKEYTDFINKYAVGLVWYSRTKDENVYYIGMSSGKFFKHLSIGQPVIVFDCPGINTIVRKYKLGKVIHSVSEIGKAYKEIMENYSFYQDNVKTAYSEKFDYLKVVKPLLKQLENLA